MGKKKKRKKKSLNIEENKLMEESAVKEEPESEEYVEEAVTEEPETTEKPVTEGSTVEEEPKAEEAVEESVTEGTTEEEESESEEPSEESATEEITVEEPEAEEEPTPEEMIAEEAAEPTPEEEPTRTEEPISEEEPTAEEPSEEATDTAAEKTETEPEAAPTKKKFPRWLILLVVLALIPIGILGVWIYEGSRIYKVCHVEAGVSVDVSDFLKQADENAYFTEESDSIDITVPGEYHLEIQMKYFTHACTLYIADTIAPAVEVQPVEIEYGQTCEATDFVTSIEDATATTVSFAEEPDFSSEENQTVSISVTDAGNNTTTVEAELIVSLVVDSLTLEAGSGKPEVSDFVLIGSEPKIISDLDAIDYNKISSHPVIVELYGTRHTVDMNIADTTAPTFEVEDINGFALVSRAAEDFVVSAEDVTAIEYSFETEPDLTLIGTQTVTIVATDEGGNQATREAELTLMEDTEPPTIQGAQDMLVFLGSNISYRSNVTVQDNCPEEVELAVDASKVNVNAVGTYPVTYTAVDPAGNSVSVTVNITVRERVYDINEVNALADGVLSGILTEGMSQHDKALAIFNYVKGHVSYISHSEKGNYVRSAYEGLVLGRGDCYVYASTSKVLLTRAGIPNMDIERIPSGATMHWWNLVDIGDGWGWYHFDTTPRTDRPVIFLWNEGQIRAYSDSHNNSHNYDRSLYPVVN